MKRSELEQELYRESQTHTPDVYDAVMASAEKEGLFVRRNEKKRRPNRKVWLSAAASVAAAAACCAIVIPSVLFNGRNNVIDGGTDGLPALSSAADTLGLGAVTTVRLLGSETGASAQTLAFSSAQTLAFSSALYSSSDAVKDQSGNFNRYFSMLESFLGERTVTSEVALNADGVYTDYAYKLTVTGYGFDGCAVNYLMYYNESVLKEKSGSDSTEQETAFVGIMLSDGREYALDGERSYKQEKGETEEEFEIRAYPDIRDKSTYVKMEQEISYESGETEKEYVYGIYENGSLKEQTCVKFENEQKGDKQETQLKIEFRQGDAKGSYKLEREIKDGYEVMKVQYSLDGESGEFYIRTTQDGRYEYSYSDGSKKYFDIAAAEKLKSIKFEI